MTRAPLPPSFVCPLCSLRSFHPKDIEQRFCARCGFVDDVIAAREFKPRNIAIERSYVDPACPERACDRCARLYRGPAVYCSLVCAVADA